VTGHLRAMDDTDDPEKIRTHDLDIHRAINAASGTGPRPPSLRRVVSAVLTKSSRPVG
jgi:hypothetical protein